MIEMSWTIVIAFLALLGGGVAAWATTLQRIARLEAQFDSEKDSQDKYEHMIAGSLTEMKASLEKLSNKVDDLKDEIHRRT